MRGGEKGKEQIINLNTYEDNDEIIKEPEIIDIKFEMIAIEEKEVGELTNKELSAVLGAIDFIICEIDDDEDLKSAKKKLEEIEKRR